MEYIWYLFLEGKQEGPYSVEQLLADPRVTLDTYVWKEGMKTWKLLADVPELARFFRRQEDPYSVDGKEFSGIEAQKEEIALDFRMPPPSFYIFLILIVLLLLYLIFIV